MLDRLIKKATPELYAVMRGSAFENELSSRLTSTLDPPDLQAVLEFNRAARFLQNRITASDLKPDRRSANLSSENLRCSDLLFERLSFGDSDNVLSLGFSKRHFTRIVASLFISYVRNPEYILSEFHHMLRPGGTLLVSTMKPDSDISVMFTNYIQKVRGPSCLEEGQKDDPKAAEDARAMLNEAASLFELEEDGFFRFYTSEELADMLSAAGFVRVRVLSSMGTPPRHSSQLQKKIDIILDSSIVVVNPISSNKRGICD